MAARSTRRASVPMVRANRMTKEIKSWSRNKLEERKLALRHDKVDKHMATRRRIHQQQKDELNRDMEENIKKTTPSLEEYLDKSKKRYHVWREREQDRLDRRYRTQYKNYLKEYSQLLNDNKDIIMSMKPLDTDSNNNDEYDHSTSEVQEFPKDNNSAVDTIGQTLSSLNFEVDDDELLVFDTSRMTNWNRRRASTGSISTGLNFSTKKIIPVNLAVINEDTDNQMGKPDNNNNAGMYTIDEEGHTERETIDNKTALENKTVMNTGKNGRSKRRTSISGTGQLYQNRSTSPEIAIGKRLDRRPTLPNIAIPLNYGN